jgi:hypothetical protein
MTLAEAKDRVASWARDVFVRHRRSVDAPRAFACLQQESDTTTKAIAPPRMGVIAILSLAVTVFRVGWLLWELWTQNPSSSDREEDAVLAKLDRHWESIQ